MNMILLNLISRTPCVVQEFAINRYIGLSGCGDTVKVLNWKLDRKRKTIAFSLVLDGEPEPISFRATGYEIVSVDGCDAVPSTRS
jgi:hypothetical protein